VPFTGGRVGGNVRSVRSPRANDLLQYERHVVLEGIFNLRDVGGYCCEGGSVRWQTLYRADGMNRLAGNDIDEVRRLRLKTIIDLRTDTEVALRGRIPAEAISAHYHHMPLLERVWDADAYSNIDDVTSFLVDPVHRHAAGGRAFYRPGARNPRPSAGLSDPFALRGGKGPDWGAGGCGPESSRRAGRGDR
jgi:hypothetical protein